MSQLRPLPMMGAFALVFILAACGGGDTSETEAAMEPAEMEAEEEAMTPPAASMALPEGVSNEMVSAGAALFPTLICTSCHGTDAAGLEGLGPNLTDAEWLNSDGSYDAIVQTITTGVAEPQQMPVTMPAKGGNAAITDQQVRELAAWIYSVSHSM